MVALAVVLAVAAPVSATATVGVGSDLGRIKLDEPVRSGQRISLPVITITNTGTEPTVYRMFALGDDVATPADASWFTFDPETLTLAPGEERPVRAVMTLPADLEAGDYGVILVARPIATPGGGDYNIAAGPRLLIHVIPGSWWSALWYRVLGGIQSAAPWSYVGGLASLGLVAAILATWVRHRRSRKRDEADAEYLRPGDAPGPS